MSITLYKNIKEFLKLGYPNGYGDGDGYGDGNGDGESNLEKAGGEIIEE